MTSVTKDDILRGLACIGRHPIYQRHAYLECNLSDLNINDISALEEYSNLLYINLSKNKLRSLDVLSNIPMLVQLDASDNELVDCLAFTPPKCTLENAWATGHNSIGSMLTLVDLSHNKIESMNSLSAHLFLECLLLSYNNISRIQGLDDLKFLTVLDISYNNLTSITGLSGLRIQELILRGNKIKSLEGVENLSCLVTLDVAFNNIVSLAPLAQCDQVNYLDVSHNEISSIKELEYLTNLQWMRRLFFTHNACCNKKLYRSRVIFRLPQIVQLDATNVSAEDKIAAMNLYGDSSGDKEMRREVFMKYFPTDGFIDFSEHLSEEEDV